jgi:uncharacterized protein
MERGTYRFYKDPRYPAPGVYFEEAAPRDAGEIRTGQPAFLGLARPTELSARLETGLARPTKLTARLETGQPLQAHWLSKWDHFAEKVGESPEGSFLSHAVRGFFDNGGERCVVVPFAHDMPVSGGGDGWQALLDKCLNWLERVDEVDLVCAPDLPTEPAARVISHSLILKHCETMGNRFAILDTAPEATPEGAILHWRSLFPTEGALYFPWIRIVVSEFDTRLVPPCGHVAGVYARTDAALGVHKAPANEVVEGAVDLGVHVDDSAQRTLNAVGVNCVRAFPGRGIRIWGARTLNGRDEWRYVNVRRLFISLRRWIGIRCQDLVFEANEPSLWKRVRDRLNTYCYDLYLSGALKGLTPDEAYYVKCDAETNPPGARELGEVVTEIGLAPVKPAEFVVVRITQSAAGTAMELT